MTKSRWTVKPAEKSGQYVVVNEETGELFRENGQVVTWVSDVAAQEWARVLSGVWP